eukprot:760679-Hanusia_phi.AAC.6
MTSEGLGEDIRVSPVDRTIFVRVTLTNSVESTGSQTLEGWDVEVDGVVRGTHSGFNCRVVDVQRSKRYYHGG